MAYYLAFDGVNDYVSTGYHLSIDFTSDDYEVEFELDFTGSKNGTICSQCIDNGAAGREFHVFIASSNFNVWFVTAGDVIDTGYRPLSRETLALSVNTSSGTYAMTSDGSPVASGALSPVGATEPTATFLIGARHAGNLSSFAFFNKADFYRLKIRKGATLIHDYDPSASGGTGSTLPDIEGAQDGTLVNFPTDGSQWVFYNDGGVVDVTGQTATYSYTAINANIDLIGSIDIVGGTATYSYTSQFGSVDLTSAIDIQGATAAYNYQSVNGGVELSGLVSVKGSTASYSYATIGGRVNLQGTITITAESAQYTYSAVGANIAIDSGLLITNYNAAFAPDFVKATFGKDNMTVRFQ